MQVECYFQDFKGPGMHADCGFICATVESAHVAPFVMKAHQAMHASIVAKAASTAASMSDVLAPAAAAAAAVYYRKRLA